MFVQSERIKTLIFFNVPCLTWAMFSLAHGLRRWQILCMILATSLALMLFISRQHIADCDFGQLLKTKQTLDLAPTLQSHAHTPRTMFQELAGMDDAAKQELWWQLTNQVGLNFERQFWRKSKESFGISPGRMLVDNFNKFAAKDSAPDQICGEFGDGHFLHRDFEKICTSKLSLDCCDPHADVKLDLTIPPQKSAEKVKTTHGMLTILVSHQVFEHLKRPSVGMANANVLLRQHGKYIFTTPFIVQDHPIPEDFYRYTVSSVHTMLNCSGFRVEVIRGLGNRRTNLAYLASVPADMIMPRDAAAFCDGLNGCKGKYYSIVGAIAVKVKDVSLADIQSCFG